MSKRIIKRFASVCPEAIDENFLSFLEPHSSFNVVSLSTNNQTSSLCSPKDYKTVTQRNDFSLTSSCKTSPKQKYLLKKNALILERARVLTKENLDLKKQLKKKCSTPKELFQTHAIKLTKDHFTKKNPDSKPKDLKINISESLSSIKEIIVWIQEQRDETPIKSIKPSIKEMNSIIKTIQTEINAKIQPQLGDEVKMKTEFYKRSGLRYFCFRYQQY